MDAITIPLIISLLAFLEAQIAIALAIVALNRKRIPMPNYFPIEDEDKDDGAAPYIKDASWEDHEKVFRRLVD